MMRKFLAFILAVTMLTSMLAGCGSPETPTEESTQNNPTSSEKSTEGATDVSPTEPLEVDPFAEKVELTWLGYYGAKGNGLSGEADTWGEKLMEEAFNVDITSITDVTQDNASVYVNSGDVLEANVVCSQILGNKPEDIEKIYNQGLIREFPEEWLWEYYPTGMQLLVDMYGQDYFDNDHHLIDGKCLFVPFSNTIANSTRMLLLRKDWMDNLKLEAPKTLEDLHDILYAFTYNDPDGNGKDDTYGMSCLFNSGYTNYGYWMIFSPFIGVTWPCEFVQDEAGTVYYPAATEGFREALRVIKEWYDEGILDPECITDDRAALRTKWSNSQIGAMPDALGQTRNVWGPAGVVGMIESVYGEDSVMIMEPITTEYGDGVVYTSQPGPNLTTSLAWCFTEGTTDEQVIRFLQIQEGLLNDLDLFIKVLHGEENVDYYFDENGAMQIMEHVTPEYKAQKGIGNSWFASPTLPPELSELQLTDEDRVNYAIAASWPKKFFNSNNVITSETNEALATYNSEVTKVVMEYCSQVMLGTDNLDDGWEAYLSKLNAAGLDKIIAEYEEILK